MPGAGLFENRAKAAVGLSQHAGEQTLSNWARGPTVIKVVGSWRL
jgi:hypothetical protein